MQDYKKKEKRKPHVLLPVMGLFMAIAFAAVAYGVAPLIVDLIREQANPQQQGQIIRNEKNFTYAFGVMAWLILFSVAMMIVAAVIGEDPDKEESLVRPRADASDKEWAKYEKQLAKIRERRQKRANEIAKEQAALEKKKGDR